VGAVVAFRLNGLEEAISPDDEWQVIRYTRTELAGAAIAIAVVIS